MGTINIYILHGWTYSLDKWETLSDFLNKENIKTIFLKIPGLTEESGEEWDLEKYVSWLDEKIKSPSIILGHSNGGRIALAYANKFPNKVKKLILIDSAGIYHNELPIRIKRFLFGSLAKAGKKITKSEAMRRILYKLAGEKDYLGASSNMRKSMVNLISTDLTSTLPNIKSDTLIIWGRDDKVTPLSDARVFNKNIKKSKLKIIDGARHSPFYSHPQEVATIIKNDL